MKSDLKACPGRIREFRTLLARLRSGLKDVPGSAVVVGEPGFGKSAFVRQWADPAVRKQMMGELSEAMRFLPIELAEQGAPTPKILLGLLADAIEGRSGGGRQLSEAEFDALLTAALAKENRPFIFLVDDFHRVTQSPDFPAVFFSFLRSIAYTRRAAFVLTSRLDIGEMAIDKEVQSSPFFNIFSKIRMGPLSPDKSREALLDRADGTAGIQEPHLMALEELAGGVPFLIRPLAEEAARAVGQNTVSTLQMARRVAHAQAATLNTIWDSVGPSIREALRQRLTTQEPLRPTERDTLLAMAQKGYLEEESMTFRSKLIALDFAARLGLDASQLEASLPAFPETKQGFFSRFFGRG